MIKCNYLPDFFSVFAAKQQSMENKSSEYRIHVARNFRGVKFFRGWPIINNFEGKIFED